MEFLIEFILELVLEGSMAATKSSKVPKPVRYILLVLLVLFFAAVIALIYLTAFLVLEESVIGFLLCFLIATFLLAASVVKFRKCYIRKTKNKVGNRIG